MRTRTNFSVTLAVVLLPLTVLGAGSPEMQTPSPPTLQTSAASARLYDLASREAQYDALRAMSKVDVQYEKAGRVQIVEGATGLFPAVRSLQPGDAPAQLLQQVGPLLMATSSDGLRVKSVEDRRLRSGGFERGGYDVFLEQTVNGLPVIDAPVNLRTTETGELDCDQLSICACRGCFESTGLGTQRGQPDRVARSGRRRDCGDWEHPVVP